MRIVMLGAMVLISGSAHAGDIDGGFEPLPNFTITTPEDLKLAQTLVDALNTYSAKVTACAEAIDSDRPENASSACTCKYPSELNELTEQLVAVERQRRAWSGAIIHVTNPADGISTSLAVPHLRAQIDGLKCE